MNATAFYRILWKEYRTQRAGWAAIALLIVMSGAVLLMDPWITRDERITVLFTAAVTLAALYALVSSVTLFATERENGTYDILRALPVGPWNVIFGKAVYSIGSAGLMFAFAWTFARVISGQVPDARNHQLIWTYCGLAAVEFWAWGMFFSLLLRRTVMAACLAGTVTAVLLCWLWNKDKSPAVAVTGRLLIISGVTALNFVLANRWFRERRLRIARASLSASRDDGQASTGLLGRFGRLVWQDMRQSAVLTAAILLTLIPLLVNIWIEWLWRINSEESIRSSLTYPFYIILMLAGALSPVLLGATIFSGDQTNYQFRFLAEHGISARLVWLSRHVRGIIVIALGLIAALLPWIAHSHEMNQDSFYLRPELISSVVLGFVVVAYACGQLCSMLFRSGILAAASSAIIAVLVCGWASIVYVFGMGWWWTVAPLPLAFLAVTWLHAPNWMLERRGRRAWLPPIFVIGLPIITILAAIPLVRIYEIPLVDPGFDPSTLKWVSSPEEKKARAVYMQAIDVLKSVRHIAEEPSGMEENLDVKSKAIALALEASRYPLPEFCPEPPDPTARWREDIYWEMQLAKLVLASGVKLQAAGELDAALDRYFAAGHIAHHLQLTCAYAWSAVDFDLEVCEQLTYWGAERGQKSERITEALRAFDKQFPRWALSGGAIKYKYQEIRRSIEPNPQTGTVQPLYGFSRFDAVSRWLPWERTRALRILNMLTASELANCVDFDAAMAAGESAPPGKYTGDFYQDTITFEYVHQAMRNVGASAFLRNEKYRRATRLVLAIQAWRLDHGSLPESLDQLTGKYIERLPIDPYNGDQFGYHPKGLSKRLEWYLNSQSPENTRVIEPGRPFLGGYYTVGNSFDTNVFNMPDREPSEGNSYEAWQHWGWVYPIPTTGTNPRATPPPPQ